MKTKNICDNSPTDFTGVYADYYHQTIYRASSWIVGIVIGYLITTNATLTINKVSKIDFLN